MALLPSAAAGGASAGPNGPAPALARCGLRMSARRKLLPCDVTGDGKADLVGRHTETAEMHAASATATAFSYLGVWGSIDMAYEVR
jgi:hypothetical protein